MTKKMLIIGGTGGLGAEITKLFENKYSVTSLGSKELDVTSFSSLQHYFNNNDFDIILNFSGFNYDSFLHKYNEEKISKAYKQVDVNINGNINLLSACLPMMRKNNFGRIIIMSSVLSTMTVSGTSIYSASKAFIDNLIKTATLENANKNITCNSIQLGYFDAGMTYRIPEEIRNEIVQKIPLKRFGKILELYNAIEFLINTEYVCGTSIKMNGGVNI